MALKTIPQSLIDSVVDVVTKSEETRSKTMQRIVSEGLKHFGVSSVSELSESDQRAFHAWTQLRLTEESCSCEGTSEEACACEDELVEDDMPGDSSYHKGGDEDAEKKVSLDEDSSSTKSKIAAHLSKISSTPRGVDRANVANKILNLLGKDPSFNKDNDKFNRALRKVVDLATDYRVNSTELEMAAQKAIDSLNESVSQLSHEIATNGAVAVGDASAATPKHADVLRDTDPHTGVTQYRLLMQYATNNGTKIYPPVSLPGAKSVQDLRALVEALPDFNDEVENALAAAGMLGE